MSLTTYARGLHAHRRNAAKWVLAIRYLRSKGLWILENGKRPKWGNDWQVAIVLECARFANDYVADSFGVHYSVGDEIKKHFGIEDDLNNVRWKANYRYDAKDKKNDRT